MTIVQWNARSLATRYNWAKIAEFQKFLESFDKIPEVLCIQETWNHKGQKELKIPGYVHAAAYRRPKDQKGGVFRNINENIILLGDFNAHNRLWEPHCTIDNAPSKEIIQFINNKGLVLLNDGSPTRHDINAGRLSALDLTFASPNLSGKSEWKAHDHLLGSDHYPVILELHTRYNFTEYKPQPRWKLDQADWSLFRQMLYSVNICIDENSSVNEKNTEFVDSLLDICNETIPKTKHVNSRKKVVPWWNNECAEVVKAKRKAQTKLRRYRTEYHLLDYRNKREFSKQTLLRIKKECWEQFCSQLTYKTNSRVLWNQIKKFNGKPFKPVSTLVVNNIRYSENRQKAEILTDQYVKVSSDETHCIEFQRKKIDEDLRINRLFEDNMELDNDQPYNAYFTIKELKIALNSKKNSAPGADTIHYEMLKQLPERNKYTLLKLINKSWEKGELPIAWKESTITPLLKPNKDPQEPKSYRPISLTSAICKTMETMVNNRLTKKLEPKLSDTQSGFRKGRSTLDQLVRLVNVIRTARLRKRKVLAVFLDLEKAFDLMWRSGVILKLTEYGIKGRTLKWIKDFLTDRKIRTKIDDTYAEFQEQENGSPQGAVLSPTLFNVIADSLKQKLLALLSRHGVDLSQFADDSAVWKSGKNTEEIIKIIQIILQAIEEWAKEWGFLISPGKTQVVLFNSFGIDPKSLPKLKLNGRELEYSESATFLGMTFDHLLTWREHIDKLISRCNNDLNLMRMVSGTSFGADKKTLLMIYMTLIRSKLDYGCQAYMSATPTQLNRLDVIQNTALRIATGAYRSTSSRALEVECNMMPLSLRREEFALKYWARSSPLGESLPVNALVQDFAIYETKREKLSNKIPYAITVQDLIKEHNLENIEIEPPIPYDTSGIRSIQPRCELTKIIKKGSTSENTAKRLGNNYVERRYGSVLKIFTDGSKDPSRPYTGCALVVPELGLKFGYKLDKNLTVYATEMVAILKALEWIKHNRPDHVVILTDSLSSIQSIDSGKSRTRPDLLAQILINISEIINLDINLYIDWCPSHCDINGNELADTKAKEAANSGHALLIKPYTQEIYSVIKAKIRAKWEKQWGGYRGFRHLLDPGLSTKRVQYSDVRRLDVAYSRLRLGTNGLKENNLFHNGADPMCPLCTDELESTQHFLLECPYHEFARIKLRTAIRHITKRYFSINLLLNPPADVAEGVREALFAYLKETGYDSKI